MLRYIPPSVIYQAYRCLFTFGKKVIGLDDLLMDYFETGKGLRKVKAAKTKHGPRDSDEEDKKVREDEICKIFEDCEEKVIV